VDVVQARQDSRLAQHDVGMVRAVHPLSILRRNTHGWGYERQCSLNNIMAIGEDGVSQSEQSKLFKKIAIDTFTYLLDLRESDELHSQLIAE
jgi:hypothetical protein